MELQGTYSFVNAGYYSFLGNRYVKVRCFINDSFNFFLCAPAFPDGRKSRSAKNAGNRKERKGRMKLKLGGFNAAKGKYILTLLC